MSNYLMTNYKKLHDKFGIIENHLAHIDKKKIYSKIDNYFENYLNSDIRILPADYINQIVWFNSVDNIEQSINTQLKKYLTKSRNNIRSFIKKSSFELKGLNKFLNMFIIKIDYFSNIIKANVIQEAMNQLNILIISDSLILMFIEEYLISFDSKTRDDIKQLFLTIKKLSKYDNNNIINNIFNKMLKTTCDIFKKHLINQDELPLPENIKKLQKLNDALEYCYQISEYYNFIADDLNVYNDGIFQIVMEYLIDVINYNSIIEIEFMFVTLYDKLNKIVFGASFSNKLDLLNRLSIEFVNLIDRILKLDFSSNILQLITILKYVDLIINSSSNKKIINQKISEFLINDELVDKINFYINELINNEKYNEALKLLNFSSGTKNKDMFFAKYYQYLIKRLMHIVSNKSPELINTYIHHENNIIVLFSSQNRIDNKLTYKIKKVIDDALISDFNNLKFNNLYLPHDERKLTVITTSYNCWDVNQSEGIVSSSIIDSNSSTLLGEQLALYQHFYDKLYNYERIINWFPHFGEISITYLEQTLIMLPIQFMVLECFTSIEILPIYHIINSNFFFNYTDKFKKDIINSLVISKLLQIKNDNLILSTKGTFQKNLIDIFISNSDYVEIWEAQRQHELIHSRQEIISTNVNHLLKLKGSLGRDDLFKQIIVMCENIFEVDDITFDKTLLNMINMDYIKFDIITDTYAKLYY